ncbi:MAG TPA: NADH-quinone oxidoreductase subunit M [Candidatus Thermoplasmatota archaeon]|nr:NADH-quinone oxidoreductase subunit M [Candidatus Thermoplasmatota archaeon]
MELPLVSIAILSALAGAGLTLAIGRKDHRIARVVALATSLVPLAIASYLLITLADAPKTATGYGFYEKYQWIPGLGIQIIFGLDGLGAPMFFLTALLVTLGIVFAWDQTERASTFHAMLMILNAAVLGVFSALDLFLFYVFWEFVLIPMYFLIAIWGGPRKKYAAIKFFIYTFTASLVMLLAFMALYFEAFPSGARSFAIEDIVAANGRFSQGFQQIVFLALFVGFAVKFPVFPFHTWLPDAHVEAPTAGSVLLAGVLLKMGSYGLIRIALPVAPFGAQWLVPLMFVIAVASMIYASAICLVQRDYKKLVAYSSIGSMGLVLLGIAASVHTGSELGLVGANFMMLAHGFISPALFMLCGVLAHNLGTRDIPSMGGLAAKLPKSATYMVIFSMAGLGLPGLAAFIAEFQIYGATWEAFGIYILIPLVYLVLSAAYYLWALQRAFFGPFTEKPGVHYGHTYDLHWHEAVPLAILLLFTALYGLWPRLLTDVLDGPVRALLLTMGVA